MKKICSFMIGVLLMSGLIIPRVQAAEVEMMMFHSATCSHCVQMKAWLMGMEEKYPELTVKEYELSSSVANQELFQKVADCYNYDIRAVPTVFIDEEGRVGFSDAKAEALENKIVECIADGCANPSEKLARWEAGLPEEESKSWWRQLLNWLMFWR